VCKTAFLKLHNVTKSRLQKNIQHNRQETSDKRGTHNSRWNQLPQVVNDIFDFIENLPSRETHYSVKTLRAKKYLPSNLNVSKLHQNFLKLFVNMKM
jgi:hypothetical protein